jgi:hypothetical protein
MPNYAIRVELKGNPTFETYQTLHAVMARLGFYQTVVGVDGAGISRTFALPHAVYFGANAAGCATVRNAVTNAVKAEVQNAVLILVVEASHWTLGW